MTEGRGRRSAGPCASARSPAVPAPQLAPPAKLQPPVRVVARWRAALGTLVGGRASRSSLLCAPAGTGKTTTLRQWIERRPAAGGLGADRRGGRRPRRPAHLSGRARCARSCPSTPPWSALSAWRCRRCASASCRCWRSALAAAPPFVLVLDDAHLLRSVRSLGRRRLRPARACPPGAQLALGTRADPPLHLARMRASRRAGGVRRARARFDRAEIAELLRLHGREPEPRTSTRC